MAQLGGDGLERYLAVGQAEAGVDVLGVEAPCAVELDGRARLAVEGRHRLAGLEGDGTARLVLEGEGRREVGLAGRQGEAAPREERNDHEDGDRQGGTFVRHRIDLIEKRSGHQLYRASRAGKNLPQRRRKKLERAKVELRALFVKTSARSR